MMWKLCLSLLVLSITASSSLPGQSVGPLQLPEFLSTAPPAEPPPKIGLERLAKPLASLPSASVGARDELGAVDLWNRSGRRPVQDGFRRRLPAPQIVALGRGAAERATEGEVVARRAGGGLVWGGRVEVQDAYRLRLHLTNVRLPRAARIWVAGGAETRGPFGVELLGPGGDLWTPSVRGGAVSIEVEIPEAALAADGEYGFTIGDVLELVAMAPAKRLASGRAAASVSCMIDETCVPPSTFASIPTYRGAIASLDFIRDGLSYICTGSLLNNARSDGTPYLLTANHCISTPAVASTLEAVWDYYDATCLGDTPDRSTLPASEGATLLASGVQSDFTLLRLGSIPGGRSLLGWNASPSAVASGTTLFRLSHPAPNGILYPQFFSSTTAQYAAAIPCPPDTGGRPTNDLSKFIHSLPALGSPFGGSSGSPLLLANGQVVGQLLGVCGSAAGVADPCLAGGTINQIDGAFSATYPSLAAWLSPATTGPGPCVPSATTLCIDDRPGDARFKVEVSFQAASAAPAPGNAVPLASLGIANGGLFWFFNPGNPEMLVKVLNGCSLGGHYWVFYAAGTNVGLSTTVTDTVTGAQRMYTNPAGTAAPPVQDTAALPCS